MAFMEHYYSLAREKRRRRRRRESKSKKKKRIAEGREPKNETRNDGNRFSDRNKIRVRKKRFSTGI